MTEVITPEEKLSRFILHRSHIRHDQTLKPDPFIPHPHADLSVTRHLALGKEDLWHIGENIADHIGKTLYGQAENVALTYLNQQLKLVSAPVPDNPNHANVTNWPVAKPAQKIIALEIAAQSNFIRR